MGRQSGFFRSIAAGSGGGAARGLLRFWLLWERLVRAIQPTTQIPGATVNAFTIRPNRYRGEPFTLPDGSVVKPGDAILDIHLENALAAEVTRKTYWALYKALTSDLTALARATEEGKVPPYAAVTALTLLGAGAKFIGFWEREKPIRWTSRFERLYFNGLLAAYTPAGTERLERGTTSRGYPNEIWLSRDELLRRYGRRAKLAGHGTAQDAI